MSASKAARNPIVYIHGLWLHGESWNQWMEFFRQNGYETIAASWPGDANTTESTRAKPQVVAGYGVSEIADCLLFPCGSGSARGRRGIDVTHSVGSSANKRGWVRVGKGDYRYEIK